MFVIIWGTDYHCSKKGSGVFYCSRCDAYEKYNLEQARLYFYLFMVPIFPLDQPMRQVVCQNCHTTYPEYVLEQEALTADERRQANEDWERRLAQLPEDLNWPNCRKI